ncbi:MAG: peptide-methionine (S)-S-oxide reductase MsrA [Verrucomicrobium sp.]|nr:peptide-methionine (S)-S-oxide reductase MsrA [Verrucomicrobium sp.]
MSARLLLLALLLLPMTSPAAPKAETAVFGMGCFWCSEALYKKFKGVEKIVCGYAGGQRPNPTYEQVCTGATGHAEVVEITYDPAVITYRQLLEIFWDVHDPTTLNRQGNDVGTQYRSVIFYQGDAQKQEAEASKKEAAARFHQEIVTEISPLPAFYPAEDYHQDYFRKHPDVPYCAYVISPKLQKLEQHPPPVPFK